MRKRKVMLLFLLDNLFLANTVLLLLISTDIIKHNEIIKNIAIIAR